MDSTKFDKLAMNIGTKRISKRRLIGSVFGSTFGVIAAKVSAPVEALASGSCYEYRTPCNDSYGRPQHDKCCSGYCGSNGKCDCISNGGTCKQDSDCCDDNVCNSYGKCAPKSYCTPDCSGKQCGDDGCGGSCGECPYGTCNNYGQCPTCTPATCESLGVECGSHDDGCGGTVDCGGCHYGTCNSGYCPDKPPICLENPAPCSRDEDCCSGYCAGVYSKDHCADRETYMQNHCKRWPAKSRKRCLVLVEKCKATNNRNAKACKAVRNGGKKKRGNGKKGGRKGGNRRGGRR